MIEHPRPGPTRRGGRGRERLVNTLVPYPYKLVVQYRPFQILWNGLQFGGRVAALIAALLLFYSVEMKQSVLHCSVSAEESVRYFCVHVGQADRLDPLT